MRDFLNKKCNYIYFYLMYFFTYAVLYTVQVKNIKQKRSEKKW